MSTTESQDNKGCELFDNYLAAKKALNTRIKQVLDILAKFKTLDVTPSEVADVVAQETTQVAAHQWRYNSGHETIYCEHYFDFRSRRNFQKCTVKIPVKYLEMSDDDIYKENKEAALAALEAKKTEIEAQIEERTRSMRNHLNRVISDIEKVNKEN